MQFHRPRAGRVQGSNLGQHMPGHYISQGLLDNQFRLFRPDAVSSSQRSASPRHTQQSQQRSAK
jgi:hypothetical protein